MRVIWNDGMSVVPIYYIIHIYYKYSYIYHVVISLTPLSAPVGFQAFKISKYLVFCFWLFLFEHWSYILSWVRFYILYENTISRVFIYGLHTVYQYYMNILYILYIDIYKYVLKQALLSPDNEKRCSIFIAQNDKWALRVSDVAETGRNCASVVLAVLLNVNRKFFKREKCATSVLCLYFSNGLCSAMGRVRLSRDVGQTFVFCGALVRRPFQFKSPRNVSRKVSWCPFIAMELIGENY